MDPVLTQHTEPASYFGFRWAILPEPADTNSTLTHDNSQQFEDMNISRKSSDASPPNRKSGTKTPVAHGNISIMR